VDKETRNHIQRATQAARALLEREYAEQLEGTFDVRLDGTIAPEPGSHLDASQRVRRTKIVAAVEHVRSSIVGRQSTAEAVAGYLREAAFTTLNRFVAFFVAAYSILRKSPPQPALLVLGDMSVQGNIKPVRSLTEPLQVAMDNGAKRALIPIANKRQFLEVNPDVLEQVDPIFYGDLRQAAFKALGLN
jgi:Lon protease (S16) C-terminal proteolytic domain